MIKKHNTKFKTKDDSQLEGTVDGGGVEGSIDLRKMKEPRIGLGGGTRQRKADGPKNGPLTSKLKSKLNSKKKMKINGAKSKTGRGLMNSLAKTDSSQPGIGNFFNKIEGWKLKLMMMNSHGT